MNQKGSRQNPYSREEHTAMYNQNRWPGGWVWDVNGNSKDYIQSNGTPTYAYDAEGILGCMDRPFPSDLYDEMVYNFTWTGGWVQTTRQGRAVVEYWTEDQMMFNKENSDGVKLGERENPVYLWLYDEMDANDIWFGGWVVYGDSATEYISGSGNNNSGSGCGCGSSGSGSGSGGMSGHGNLSAGTEQKLYFLAHDVSLRITLEWGDGTFNAIDAPPSIYIRDTIVTNKPETSLTIINNIQVLWCAAFLVQININYTYGNHNPETIFEYYNIPEHYRS